MGAHGRIGRGGFTLVEVLVALAVLAILAAVLFPVFAQARDAAQRANCISNLHQIASAHQMYVQDNDDVLPSWSFSGADGNQIWPGFLCPYYHDIRILDEGLTTASDKADIAWLADYALCTWGPGGNNSRAWPYWRWPGTAWDGTRPLPLNLCQVVRPSQTVQLADGITGRYNSSTGSRHRDRWMNAAFVDGHAKAVTADDWNRVGQDEWGYFYWMAAADR
jgi:prepilin-type N-terminal cleavage/methylation domain-containing protein/prepilin-type processing-associated H-X9-DG protein